MLPFRLLSSMSSIFHSMTPLRASNRNSPSHEFTAGGSRHGGHGMEMTTFCKSIASDASYSMLTAVSPPLIVGQQLMLRGSADSSLVENRHFNTPSAEPHGNGRLGSFKPKIFSFACRALSMFGCVLN